MLVLILNTPNDVFFAVLGHEMHFLWYEAIIQCIICISYSLIVLNILIT